MNAPSPVAEFRTLLALARPRPPSPPVLPDEPIDWRRVLSLAAEHDVVPLVHANLAARRAAVPRAVAAEFGQRADHQARRNLLLVHRLGRIVGDLRARGIRVVPFKGPMVAIEHYGGLALRSFSDLDFLVRPAQVVAVLEYLRDTGHRTVYPRPEWDLDTYLRVQCEFLLANRDDGVLVEPHWALVPPCMHLSVDYAAWFARTREVRTGAVSFAGLAVEDELLALCVHGSKHQWTGLKLVADVAALLASTPGLDWALALGRARRCGAERMVLLGVALARSLLGATLPGAVRERIARDARVRALCSEVEAALLGGGATVRSPFRLSAFRLRIRERWRDRIGSAVRTALVPASAHFDFIALPGRFAWLYALVVPLHDLVLLPAYRLLSLVRRVHGMHRVGRLMANRSDRRRQMATARRR